MINLIGYIPQTSQGIYKDNKKTFCISAPFKKFFVEQIGSVSSLKKTLYVPQDVFFPKFEKMVQFLQDLHLIEMIKNNKLKHPTPETVDGSIPVRLLQKNKNRVGD